MRITRQKLLDLARAEVVRRAEQDSGLLSAYLIGSVVTGEPLLGGKTDIDLVLIHELWGSATREIVALSDDVHIDISHHARDVYAQPIQLRTHPWLGPCLAEPVILFDPQHFLERVQAGVRGQFFRADHAAARARAFLDTARRTKSALEADGLWVHEYCRGLMQAANAAACLAGPPASGRRLASTLRQRTADLGHPEIHHAFLRLLGTDLLPNPDVTVWLEPWARSWEAATKVSPSPLLSPTRRAYFQAGVQALAETGQPEAALWPLLVTWQYAFHGLNDPADSPERSEWEALLSHLGLGARDRPQRAAEFETYLDHIEGVLEAWAEGNGV